MTSGDGLRFAFWHLAGFPAPVSSRSEVCDHADLLFSAAMQFPKRSCYHILPPENFEIKKSMDSQTKDGKGTVNIGRCEL